MFGISGLPAAPEAIIDKLARSGLPMNIRSGDLIESGAVPGHASATGWSLGEAFVVASGDRRGTRFASATEHCFGTEVRELRGTG